jgi:small-conductance mechanosensitive channel
MHIQNIQLIETLVILVLYIIAFLVTKTIINNALRNIHLQRARRKIILKVIHLFITLAVVVLISGVWGLKQNEIAVFVSTILTALGIAFFAQWSLLSNITAGVILFFNHPLKLGDNIKVLDKENPCEGEIIELSYFFVHLMTATGDKLTIPNSLILQKGVSLTTPAKKEDD